MIFLKSRLAGCYQSISKATHPEEKEIHARNRNLIEQEIESENRRSEYIDGLVDPVLEKLSKEKRAVYHKLLKDFQDGKY
jgi:hypothetical protein